MIDYDQLADFAGYDGHSARPAAWYGIEYPYGHIWNDMPTTRLPPFIHGGAAYTGNKIYNMINQLRQRRVFIPKTNEE